MAIHIETYIKPPPILKEYYGDLEKGDMFYFEDTGRFQPIIKVPGGYTYLNGEQFKTREPVCDDTPIYHFKAGDIIKITIT